MGVMAGSSQLTRRRAPGARRWRFAWVCGVSVWAAVGTVFAEGASAIPAPPPPRQSVALVRRGAVWFDEGSIFFQGFHSSLVRLWTLNSEFRPRIASSATAVAMSGGEKAEFVGGVPPGPLTAIAAPKLRGGDGCKGWLPGGEFVVAGDDLVAAGECQWDDRSLRQPLFVRSLRGGRWRVLRWLAVDSLPGGDGLYYNVSPVLAAEGELVAVGVQFSGARMETSILDVRSGRTVARFDLPDGYLAFASPKRLVLSVPAPSAPDEVDFPLDEWSGPFDLALYSTRGRRIAGLGSAEQLPLVSGMHLLTEELDTDTLSVRSVTGGAPEPVVGFNEARERLALAFRWPALVVVEATRVPLLPSEVHCWSGDYSPAGSPFLGLFDLAGSPLFVPAPTLVRVEPSQPLTNCGPPPP